MKKSFYIFIISITIVTLYLAIWQIKRYEYKKQKNANFQSELVEIEGVFNFNQQISISSRKFEGKTGKYIYTIFHPKKAKPILVNRGFVAKEDMDKLPVKGYSYITKIKIYPNIAKERSWFIPKNDFKNNNWIYLDLKDAANYFNLDLGDSYFTLIKDDNNKFNRPVLEIMAKEHKFFNPHLKYIYFWFLISLANIILLVFYSLLRNY